MSAIARWIQRALVFVAVAMTVARPAQAYRGGAARGPRGGSVAHVGGPYRGATVAHGAYGGTAVHAHGPYGGGTAVRGPYGGGAASVHGHGGYYGGGPGRYGYRGGYYGAHAIRPGWGGTRYYGYQRGFLGYPGWHSYGMRYGLIGPLAAFSSLAFLSSGLLVGSYASGPQTVYVYVVQENGEDVEYRVDSNGQVLSRTVVTQ